MPIDILQGTIKGAEAPITRAEAFVPGADFTPVYTSRAVYVGSTGDLVVTLRDEPTVTRTFKNIPSGSLFPFRVEKIINTGTTATDILLLV